MARANKRPNVTAKFISAVVPRSERDGMSHSSEITSSASPGIFFRKTAKTNDLSSEDHHIPDNTRGELGNSRA